MSDLDQAHDLWPVPERFATVTPAEWAVQGAKDYPGEWDAARTWLQRFRRYLSTSPQVEMRGHGLALIGPTGTGKTMLAASFLNYLGAKGFTTAFLRSFNLSSYLRSFDLADIEGPVALLGAVACVVVDDIGRMGDNVPLTEAFLRTRMDEAKPTIVTMNNQVNLSDTLDSLIHEYTVIHLAGDDRRVNPLGVDGARW